ncbi:MAG TPA: GNAT family N-acetyltransferase [Candidatus Limiplasma sp.]|nr:GNAT family N-acetyltransferase [Candidatus Limiplasma sp.]
MIRQANIDDAETVSALAHRLWPHAATSKLQTEYREMLSGDDSAVFLATINAQAVAFAQCGLRHDYVEGTGSSPVGYLEGIYVDSAFRRQGVAKALLARCQQWARAKSCTEFASDCELTNEQSLRFHLGAGFQEANRIICFTKRL